MKYLKQFGIILTISFVGELLNHLIPLPIPASIYGICILFLCLLTKVIPLSAVEDAGNFLIQIMPLMFVPAAVGLLNSWGIIQDSYMEYLVILCVSTVVVMAVSGKVTECIVKHSQKEPEEGAQSHV